MAEMQKTYNEFVDYQIKFFDKMIDVLETGMDELVQLENWPKKKKILRSEVFSWFSRCSPMMKEKELICLDQCKTLFSKLE